MRNIQGRRRAGIVARWRIAAGAAVLAALAFLAVRLAPVFMDNYQLQRYVEEIAQNAGNQTRSDDLLRTWVVEKAAALDLPVRVQDVQVKRSSDGIRINVRYLVRVELPVYSIDLHFYPSAGVQ